MYPFTSPFAPHQHAIARQRLPAAALLAVVLLLLTACLGRRENAPMRGDTARLTGVAMLVCDQACANQAQCGESVDRGQVVLLNWLAPATYSDGQTLAVRVDTNVQIQQIQSMPAVHRATGAAPDVLFYQVFLEERQQNAWVAGWCIQGMPEATPQ